MHAALDAQPNLEEVSKGPAERALRKAQFVGPPRRARQLGLRVVEIAPGQPVECQHTQRHGHRIGGCEPHRIDHPSIGFVELRGRT